MIKRGTFDRVVVMFMALLAAATFFTVVYFIHLGNNALNARQMERVFENVHSVELQLGTKKIDLTTNTKVRAALAEVRPGHWIPGRPFKGQSYECILLINGISYKVRAAVLESGPHLTRALLTSDDGSWYEGDKLGQELIQILRLLKNEREGKGRPRK